MENRAMWTPEDLRGKELCRHGERRQFCASCNTAPDAPISQVNDVLDSVEWPEHMIEAECTNMLENDGWRALRTDPVSDRGRGKGFGELGMADHLYMRYRYHEDFLIQDHPEAAVVSEILWIEFKSCDGKPAKHQIEWHTKERARGAVTWIASVDFPASVAGFVEHYRKSGLNRGRV